MAECTTRLTRREFLKLSGGIGLSAAVTYLTGCGPAAAPVATPTILSPVNAENRARSEVNQLIQKLLEGGSAQPLSQYNEWQVYESPAVRAAKSLLSYAKRDPSQISITQPKNAEAKNLWSTTFELRKDKGLFPMYDAAIVQWQSADQKKTETQIIFAPSNFEIYAKLPSRNGGKPVKNPAKVYIIPETALVSATLNLGGIPKADDKKYNEKYNDWLTKIVTDSFVQEPTLSEPTSAMLAAQADISKIMKTVNPNVEIGLKYVYDDLFDPKRNGYQTVEYCIILSKVNTWSYYGIDLQANKESQILLKAADLAEQTRGDHIITIDDINKAIQMQQTGSADMKILDPKTNLVAGVAPGRQLGFAVEAIRGVRPVARSPNAISSRPDPIILIIAK